MEADKEGIKIDLNQQIVEGPGDSSVSSKMSSFKSEGPNLISTTHIKT